MRITTLTDCLKAAGARSVHEARVLRAWTRALPLDRGGRPPEYPSRPNALLPVLGSELEASRASAPSTPVRTAQAAC